MKTQSVALKKILRIILDADSYFVDYLGLSAEVQFSITVND
jgi:hypothetical protein